MKAMYAAMRGLALLGTACKKNSVTAPTPTPTPAATVAAPTVSEDFSGTVPVGGFKFYSFSVAARGTVNLTLVSVRGAFVPATVTMGLGIGIPAGTDCTVSSTVSTAAGATAQVTGTYDPGIYCARISDVGNLFAPATIAISIAHP